MVADHQEIRDQGGMRRRLRVEVPYFPFRQPWSQQLPVWVRFGCADRAAGLSFDSGLERARNSFGVRILLSLERLGFAGPPLSLRSEGRARPVVPGCFSCAETEIDVASRTRSHLRQESLCLDRPLGE
jgi:hypothetical protein